MAKLGRPEFGSGGTRAGISAGRAKVTIRKVSNRDAAKIAAETVGKAPYGRPRAVISNRSEITEREGTTRFKAAERASKRIERVKKLTGSVTIKKISGKTAGDIAKEKQIANVARRDKFAKDMKPTKRVVKKIAPSKPKIEKTPAGGTVTRPGGKIDANRFKKVVPQDVKDIVKRRTVTKTKPNELNIKLKNAANDPRNSFAKSREAEKSAKLARQEIADKKAEDRAKDLAGAMNRQYKESGTTWRNPATGKLERTQTKVADPMGEPERIQRATKRAVEGTKNSGAKVKPDLKLSPEAKKKFAQIKTINWKIKRGI